MQVAVQGSLSEHHIDTELRFPLLPIDDHISSWLQATTPQIMASLADDSSVDDNVSSIGDSTWDIIDEGSARSDDEDQRIERSTFPLDEAENEQPTLTSTIIKKRPEVSQDGELCLGYDEVPIDTSSEPEASSSASPSDGAEKEHATESLTTGLPNLQDSDLEDTIHVHEKGIPPPHKLTFEVPTTAASEDDTTVEVSKVMAWPASLQLDEMHIKAAKSEPLLRKIRQQMSTSNLALNKPYRVMYLGPRDVKQRIMHKIGSALFESVPLAVGSFDMETSRVTVVPLSAFGPDREVALLGSVGLDMCIEEWTSASTAIDALGKNPLEVLVNNRKVVQSSWNPRRSRYELSHGYHRPDLAIVVMSGTANIRERESRFIIHTFLRRHDVPTLLIGRLDRPNPADFWSLDYRMPHFSVETTTSHRIITRLPIDLDTFLDIDALQMNRNLACLKPAASEAATSSITTISLPFRHELQKAYHFIRSQPWSGPLMKILVMTLLIHVASNYLMAPNDAFLPRDGATTLAPSAPAHQHAEAQSLARASTHTAAIPSETLPSRPIAGIDLTSTRSKQADLAALLPESMLLPNKSDKFMVHVIGDCHVIMRPPRWFGSLKKAPPLHFRVKRQHKSVDFDFSVPFDGVYVLKLPREDAHGLMNISVWTSKKPKINETFQVDLGTPWLKSAGWQAAAQVVSEQVQEEWHSAHASLSKAYTHTSAGVQTLFKDATKAAEVVMKEVEKVGTASLDQTLRTTEIMVARSTELSHQLSDAIQRHSGLASDPLAHLKQANIREDLARYTRQISHALTEQAEALTQAATGLNVRALAQEVQAYREKNLKETQVKALHMWWKVRGGPPPQLRNLKREQRRAKRCRGKWNRK